MTVISKNRSAPPEELIPQFDYVKEISEQFGFVNIGVKNYEADDVIGTLAQQYSTDNDVYIITGDKDLLQCINDNVEVWLIKKVLTFIIDIHYIVLTKNMLLNHKQLIDIKALMGDTADGYAGVKGIGEKTAIKLIQQYQSVENVVENIDALSAGQRNKINDNLDELYLSKRLAEIHTQVPIDSERF